MEGKSPIGADTPTLCNVCAWRADCKKKFSYQHSPVSKCPDFTRDESLPEGDEQEDGGR